MPGTKQVRDSVLQAIGNTPVVRLQKVVSQSMGEVLVKLEVLQSHRLLQRSHGVGND